MSDIDLVRKCLSDWKRFAYNLRYGGLMKKLHQTESALDALDRIERPSLFQLESTPKERGGK